MPDSPSPLDAYHALLRLLDEHWERVAARHGEHLRCGLGCTACCRDDLGVFRVEAEQIAAWLDEHELPPRAPGPGALDHHDAFEQVAGPVPCAFLGPEGACAIYPVRPVICRSHGLPVRLRSPSTQPATTDGRSSEGREAPPLSIHGEGGPGGVRLKQPAPAGQRSDGQRGPGGMRSEAEPRGQQREGGPAARDVCPLNFTDLDLSALPEADTLALEPLNQRLALIDLLYCRAQGEEPVRVPLSVLREWGEEEG